MTATLLILGAGPGTGRALAHTYDAEGWNVALVARRSDPLTALADSIRRNGGEIAAFPADITNPHELRTVIDQVRERLGRIDAIAFTAASDDGFVPAADLTSEQARTFADLFLYPLITTVQLTLADLRGSEHGAIFYVNGASALGAPAGMSGPAPAMAAARNYLATLRDELAGDVFVGATFVAAMIEGSAAADAAAEWNADGSFPSIDAAQIAGSIWDRHQHGGAFETLLP